MTPSEEVIQEIASRSDTCLLAFSGGKDSLAAWIAIRPHFKRVIPFFAYLIPDLEFVEDTIRYYERQFSTRIIRVPHPSFWRMIGALTFQPPERIELIDEFGPPSYGYTDVYAAIREDHNLPDDTYVASGVRAVDSPLRWGHFKRHGAINETQRLFYPVYDWRKDRLIAELRRAGVKLPREYRLFGRSFDGIDLRFLWQIRQHFPRDYERILFWFPLADMELARYQFAQRRPENE